MLPTLHSLSSYYSMLQHVEKQKEVSAPIPGFSNDSASFNAYTQNPSYGRNFTQNVQFDHKRNFPTHPPTIAYRNYNSPQSESKRFPSSSIPISGLFCRYCKKSGHLIDRYYKLLGYTPDPKSSKENKSASCVLFDNPTSDAGISSLRLDDHE